MSNNSLNKTDTCSDYHTISPPWFAWSAAAAHTCFLLDVVQTARVWFEDGRMMEHLVKGDAEEDNIQLKHTTTTTTHKHQLIFSSDGSN